MARRLFQIFFGSQADEVLDTYRQLSQFHASRNYLLQNKEEIETDLNEFNDEHRDLKQDKKRLAKIESEITSDEARLKQLKRNAKEVERSLSSGWQCFCANFMSALSSSYDSVADMQAMRTETMKQIGEIESRLRKHKKGLGRFRQEVKRDSRSQDSYEFARKKLKANIKKVEERIVEIDESLNLVIQDLAVSYPLQVLLHKRGQIANESTRKKLMGVVMRLRQASRNRGLLQSIPEATPEERNMPFGVVDVVKGVKRGFVEERADMAGRMSMSGRGSAHKRVRSGNSTRWKKIDVAFSGSCNAVFRIDSTDWGSEPLVKCLEDQAREQFVSGLTQGRQKYSGRLLAKLEQEVLTYTAELRSQLEASLA